MIPTTKIESRVDLVRYDDPPIEDTENSDYDEDFNQSLVRDINESGYRTTSQSISDGLSVMRSGSSNHSRTLKTGRIAKNILDKTKVNTELSGLSTANQSNTDSSSFNNLVGLLTKPLGFNSPKRIQGENEYLKRTTKVQGTIITKALLDELSKPLHFEKTIKFSKEYIESKIPGRPKFYYSEVSNLLANMEEITENNYTIEFNKFRYFDDITSLISSFTSELVEVLSKNIDSESLKDTVVIKEEKKLFGLIKISNPTDLLQEFNKFSVRMKDTKIELEDELKKLHDIKFRLDKSLSRFNFFNDFISFLIEEIERREILPKDKLMSSLLVAKGSQFKTTNIIITQTRATLEIHLSTINNTIMDINDYLENLKPSLDLLFIHDKEQFFKKFKEYING